MDSELMYSPRGSHESRILRFLALVNKKYELDLSDYNSLYLWSISHIDEFWSTIWDDCNIIGVKGDHIVDKNVSPSDNPPWFSGASLNWAENILSCRSPHKTAIIQASKCFDCQGLLVDVFFSQRNHL